MGPDLQLLLPSAPMPCTMLVTNGSAYKLRLMRASTWEGVAACHSASQVAVSVTVWWADLHGLAAACLLSCARNRRIVLLGLQSLTLAAPILSCS